MTEMIYEYDGSFEGFLCCVFESYAQKEVLTAIVGGEDPAITLFPVRTVETDPAHAARVLRKVGVELADHLIFTEDDMVSLKDSGLLNGYPNPY